MTSHYEVITTMMQAAGYTAHLQVTFVTYQYHILTAESVLGICIAYLADCNTTEKYWYWPNTNKDNRISVAIIIRR